MFKNLLGSISSMVQSGDKKAALGKLKEAVEKSIADNLITAEEIAELNKLQKDLGITDAEMADVKIDVLDSLMEKINADGKITEEELKIFNEIKSGLGVDYKTELSHSMINKEELLKGVDEVKGFLLKLKDKSVDLGGSLINKAKDAMSKDEKK